MYDIWLGMCAVIFDKLFTPHLHDLSLISITAAGL